MIYSKIPQRRSGKKGVSAPTVKLKINHYQPLAGQIVTAEPHQGTF